MGSVSSTSQAWRDSKVISLLRLEMVVSTSLFRLEMVLSTSLPRLEMVSISLPRLEMAVSTSLPLREMDGVVVSLSRRETEPEVSHGRP